jgi:hypothetical protein
MITCKITIKIQDYFPKIDTIPYENYICLFTYGDYEGQIPFLPDDSEILQHQIKNVSSDIKYKVHVLDYNDKSLIGMCEMNISYEIINKISPPNGFVQEQQKKLLIDLKTKRKLFGTIVNIGDIFLNIYAEVLIVSRSSLEQKNNIKNKKNLLQNTPQCYIKYNFQLNQSDYSPKSSKNKSSLINSNSEKHTLNSSKQDKCFTNKHSNYNLINYKINKENRDEENNNINSKKTYTNNFNNNVKKGFKNYSSRIQQKKYSNNNVLKEQNRKTIMDLLQQKKMMEKKFENNESEKFENFERGDQNMPIIEKKNVINKKEGYLAEQNFNSQNGLKLENKYIINNHKLKKQNQNLNQNKDEIKIYNKNNKIIKGTFKKSDNQLNKGKINDVMINDIDIKNPLSPNMNNLLKNEDNDFIKNLSKTVKSNNVPEGLNNKYIYKSKNKIVKMGKAFSKNQFNVKNNKIVNNKNYLTNADQNGISTNPDNNNNNNNANTTLLSTYSADDDYLDIDKIILEKGAELRSDFHMQLKQSTLNNNYNYANHVRNKEQINNNIIINNKDEGDRINDSNNGIIGGTHFNMDTPRTEKMSQYSSTQSLNNTLTQENLKNNCLKLIEFYSLLNLKMKKINPKNLEIQKKLLIFKELFSTEMKKSNKITNKTNLNHLIYNISSNINGPMNEKIIYLFPKIKKLESSIYQYLFDVHFADEDIIKFKEYENYDEQTKIFLLLTIVKNLISKYGNISQIFGNEILKKNILKQCLINYDLTEKEEGDKDYVNLEELSHEIKLKNENEIKEFNEQMDNKFKVIKEVDEDKEEENDEEEEEIKDSNEKKENKNSNTNTNNKKESKINSKTNSKSNSNEKNKSEENEINKNLDMDVDMDLNDIDIKDEDIIEKILLEDFKKNYKENKYFFEKIGFNEYLYNNIKVRGLIDKDGDIKIMLEENNEEYYLDDFIKLFNEEKDNGFEENKNSNNGNDDNINFDMNINSDNKEIIENINNISDINNDKEYKEIESEEEKNNENNENNKIEKDDNNRENGM